MTPERKKYLAKCSKREVILRLKIKEAKQVMKAYKFGLNREHKLYPLTKAQILYDLQIIREAKITIIAYRHELHRLKGMDSVVVPKRAEGYIGVFVCSCGSDVIANYCPNCGRRILWEKVK